jgi:hypothetical protein
VGRLFWKFFAFVLLAQLAVIIAIGVLLWLADGRADVISSDRAADRIAEVQVDAGAEVLRYAGAGGFRNWSEHERQPTVLAVDAAGRDVLGRPVSLHVATEVRQLQRDRSESTGRVRCGCLRGSRPPRCSGHRRRIYWDCRDATRRRTAGLVGTSNQEGVEDLRSISLSAAQQAVADDHQTSCSPMAR